MCRDDSFQVEFHIWLRSIVWNINMGPWAWWSWHLHNHKNAWAHVHTQAGEMQHAGGHCTGTPALHCRRIWWQHRNTHVCAHTHSQENWSTAAKDLVRPLYTNIHVHTHTKITNNHTFHSNFICLLVYFIILCNMLVIFFSVYGSLIYRCHVYYSQHALIHPGEKKSCK